MEPHPQGETHSTVWKKKAVKANIDIKDKSKATELFIKAQKILDTAASKKVIHKNAAARTKSRLSNAIKALG